MSTSIDDFEAQHAEHAAVADMLERLSRRQVALVNRVLAVLEQLEDEETSPSRLDRLFQLDHLATLLRRSATSLGILVDSAGPRDGGPIPLADVLQAATAGVDDYRRVDLPEVPPGEVVGRAATDLVHLLTELIDYSLASSAEPTVVRVHPARSGEPRVLTVVNHGLRLPDDHLAAVNVMLRPGGVPPADCPWASGLYVVSRLAHRHGVTVLLERSDRGGVVAAIRVPCTLLDAHGGRHAGPRLVADRRPDPLARPWDETAVPPDDRVSIFSDLERAWRSPPGGARRDG